MIAGLTPGAWLLIGLATVPGLLLAVSAYRAHARGDARDPVPPAGE